MFKRIKKKGTYGASVVLMSSDKRELELLKKNLYPTYQVVMDIDKLENQDYALVLYRGESVPQEVEDKEE